MCLQSGGSGARECCCSPSSPSPLQCSFPYIYIYILCVYVCVCTLASASYPLHTESIIRVMLPSEFLLDNWTIHIPKRYKLFFQKDFPAGCHQWCCHGYGCMYPPCLQQLVWNPGYTGVFHPLDCDARVGNLALNIAESSEPRTVLFL